MRNALAQLQIVILDNSMSPDFGSSPVSPPVDGHLPWLRASARRPSTTAALRDHAGVAAGCRLGVPVPGGAWPTTARLLGRAGIVPVGHRDNRSAPVGHRASSDSRLWATGPMELRLGPIGQNPVAGLAEWTAPPEGRGVASGSWRLYGMPACA